MTSLTHGSMGRAAAAALLLQDYVDMTPRDVAPQSLAEEVAEEKLEVDSQRGVPPHTTDKQGVHDIPQMLSGGAHKQ